MSLVLISDTSLLINFWSFTICLILFCSLGWMAWRSYRFAPPRGGQYYFLLFGLSAMGIIWNTDQLLRLFWVDFIRTDFPRSVLAVSFALLSLIPVVIVHSAIPKNEEPAPLQTLLGGITWVAAFLSIGLHLYALLFLGRPVFSPAITYLSYFAVALAAVLGVLAFYRKVVNPLLWIGLLLFFAFGINHLAIDTLPKANTFVEFISHHPMLPLAFALVYQNFRFPFADLFLKRTLGLVLMSLMVFVLFAYVVKPLENFLESIVWREVQAENVLLTLWISTMLLYPAIMRFANWLVDSVVLRRRDFRSLLKNAQTNTDRRESEQGALEEFERYAKESVGVGDIRFSENFESAVVPQRSLVDFVAQPVLVTIPTSESPCYRAELRAFTGAGQLLSDEIDMLERLAMIAGRRIDSLRIVQERHELELREQEKSKLVTEAKLSALRAQINPHFLFNALTTISYLIKAAPDKAFDTLMQLTQLLRGMLRPIGEFARLQDEITLIESYLRIEKARFEERLETKINVPADLRDLRIPTLLLQPLVENAIKHGISESREGGMITISAKLDATRRETSLLLSVENTGSAFDELKTQQRRESGGIGLNNITQRLRLHYSENAALTLTGAEGVTRAELKLPVSARVFPG